MLALFISVQNHKSQVIFRNIVPPDLAHSADDTGARKAHTLCFAEDHAMVDLCFYFLMDVQCSSVDLMAKSIQIHYVVVQIHVHSSTATTPCNALCNPSSFCLADSF